MLKKTRKYETVKEEIMANIPVTNEAFASVFFSLYCLIVPAMPTASTITRLLARI